MCLNEGKHKRILNLFIAIKYVPTDRIQYVVLVEMEKESETFFREYCPFLD